MELHSAGAADWYVLTNSLDCGLEVPFVKVQRYHFLKFPPALVLMANQTSRAPENAPARISEIDVPTGCSCYRFT